MIEYTNITFDKSKTAIIKGFAIVFMIILHVFGGSGWYDVDLPMNHNESLISFMGVFKICVGIFVFMVGYGYAFSKYKDLKYSVHHIKRLLTTFWLILFCFAFPAAYSSIGGGTELITNMLGVSSTLCWVSWFVYFYIWAMIVMPFAGRLIDRKPVVWAVILMGISYAGMLALHHFTDFSANDWTQALFDCLLNTPLMLLGYLFARKKWYERIPVPSHWLTPVMAVTGAAVVLIVRANVHGVLAIPMELIYSPVMILCILVLFTSVRLPICTKVFTELGDKSVYMWFFHALFFTAATRPVFARFVLISDNLWIIALWTIVLSYICSAVIKKIVEY